MANGLVAEKALAMAQQRGLIDSVGLHLNLTEGRCLAPAELVPSLLLPGEGVFRGKVGLRTACAAGEVDPAHAALEAEAQVRWFVAATGRVPAWVDGHQHCNVVPRLAATLARALGAAGVTRTRIPHEIVHQASAVRDIALCPVCAVVSSEALAARAVYEAHGMNAAARFVGLSLCGRAYSAEMLACAVAAQLAPGGDDIEVEVMVHPGHESAPKDQWDSFDASSARQEELDTLCSAALRERLQALGQLDTGRVAVCRL
jgi:predicted glycoside hydrolase/deacetylase ChbG (UPF0249 family)